MLKLSFWQLYTKEMSKKDRILTMKTNYTGGQNIREIHISTVYFTISYFLQKVDSRDHG